MFTLNALKPFSDKTIRIFRFCYFLDRTPLESTQSTPVTAKPAFADNGDHANRRSPHSQPQDNDANPLHQSS
jgi:hypothetical protein